MDQKRYVGARDARQRQIRASTLQKWPPSDPTVCGAVSFGGSEAGASDDVSRMVQSHPPIALVAWERYVSRQVDGWMFRVPGFRAEPCPEDAWKLGPHVHAIPDVAEIMAREGRLAVVLVENPRTDLWLYVYTISGGGHWQIKGGSDGVSDGKPLAAKTLLEGFAA